MRALAFLVVAGCAQTPPPAHPSNTAPPEAAEPAQDDVVIEHDVERIEQRGRDLYEEARRRAAVQELRAKIRDGRVVCTPTGNKGHGPSAICTEKP